MCLPNPPARPSLARCVLRRMDYLTLSVPEEVTDYDFAADKSAFKVAWLCFCRVPVQSFEQSCCFGSLCAIEACNVSQCVAAPRCLAENDHLRLSEGGSLHSVLHLDGPARVAIEWARQTLADLPPSRLARPRDGSQSLSGHVAIKLAQTSKESLQLLSSII